MKIQQLLEAAGQVGRKYQHIEDLVIANGSAGGLHAVERMKDMVDHYDSIELKWDGMPVVYWGRNEQGVFQMIPKNAWAYLKTGKTQTGSGASTIMNSPKDVYNFIMGTGSGDDSRGGFAEMFAKLWPYFEKISPQKGFIEGGLLFYPGAEPKLNPRTKTYDFKPNITTFHVPVDSDLGRKIKSAKVMVAATGYYASYTAEESRFPNAEQLSTPDVIVQGTTYAEQLPGISTSGLDKVEQFIKANAQIIDNYLAPKPGLKNPGGELYMYLNQHLRTSGLVRDFPSWAQQNLSEKKAQTLLSDKQGYEKTLGAVEALTNEKMNIIKSLNSAVHHGIMQTNPEGYAQAHPEVNFNNPLPGQFVKMIDQLNWKPRKL